MSLDTQRCYICGRFFDDKVKLGLHLSPCYSEAVTVRRELWHPHPLDLVDEQRYTEYMRGKFKEREREIADAQRRGVSFVTASNFDAIKGSLSPSSRNVPASGMGSQRPTSRSGLPLSVPPSEGRPQSALSSALRHQPPSPSLPPAEKTQREQIAAPVRQVVTGVTSLRNELADELAKIRQLRQTEEQLVGERQRAFEELCGQIGASRSRRGLDDSNRLQPPAPVSPTRFAERFQTSPPHGQHVGVSYSSSSSSPLPKIHQQQRHYVGTEAGTSSCHRDSDQATMSSLAPTETEDGRLKCPWCGKLFGRKGYEVHAKRCSRPANDFTWSRDAEYVRDNPEERVKADHDRVSYGRQFEQTTNGVEGQSGEAWQQFMVTYPRPILPEKPPSPQSQQRPVSPARQNALKQMVNNELSAHRDQPADVTAPCQKCGRYFYHSRLAVHEAGCVAKPRR